VNDSVLRWRKSLLSQPSHFKIIVLVCATLAASSLTPVARSQVATSRPFQSFYKSLDHQSVDAKDNATIRALALEIHNRTLFGPMPQSVLERLVRAQQGFLAGHHPSVTEAAVADAVNAMGNELDPVIFTGTNALQVRLLRIGMLPSLPSLMASPSPRPSDKIVASDLSPIGGAYLGLLLLRQKLSNPAWFGDPETQNKRWAAAKPAQSGAAVNKQIRAEDEPPEQTNLRLMLHQGFTNESSTTTKAYHHFLDSLGVQK